MVAADIPAGLQLCRSSGWNQLESDWCLFLQLSPTGCRVAEKNGNVVGTFATIRYQDRFSWLAMVLVDPQHRRAGIGTRLLQESLAFLGTEVCVRLDATPAGREVYRQHGFADEYPLSRLTRSVDAAQVAPVHPTIRPIREQDLSAVLHLDRSIFGADREQVLRSLYARSPDCAWIAAASRIRGYCFGRPGFLYHQLGPVIADHEDIARDLVLQCLAYVRNQRVGIDAPAHSRSWLHWLRSNGFEEERPFIRMHRGEVKYLGQRERVFAVVGPEFG